MAVDAESVVEITHSSFLDNEAPHGGAVYMAELTEISISQSRFENNLGSLYGGAIFTEGILTVDESTFQDNFGIEGVSGGAKVSLKSTQTHN